MKTLEKNKKGVKHILLLTKIDFVSNAEVFKMKEYEKYHDDFEAIISNFNKKTDKTI